MLANMISLCDMVLIVAIYRTSLYIDSLITPEYLSLPSSMLHSSLHFILWALYAFGCSLPMFGLWVCAHECGHQAFSESEKLNHVVGWILHSRYVCALYHSQCDVR